MKKSVYLITPPFTQLNTPYPATAYLKGFLNTKNISSYQSDLGIEVILALFNSKGLENVFKISEDRIIKGEITLSENAQRMMSLKRHYLQTIDSTILFLQGKNATLAHHIANRNYLPEASRFYGFSDLHWSFGNMGIHDKAKFLGTMFLEDISDFIKECIDPYFGFSRYAEKLGRSANSFDELHKALQKPLGYLDTILVQLLHQKIKQIDPELIAISVPFPGNLFAALRCAQFIKQQFPDKKIAMGGGYANTELRSLTDARVFEIVDYICLDDGEAPIEQLINHVLNQTSNASLKRTYLLKNGQVHFENNEQCSDYKQGQVGTPDYSDFYLDKYLQAIEINNPMHSLWSNGRWNKLTMAHGCYWGKCTFCDTSLDYIKRYEPLTAKIICDRMEEMVEQTKETGFHFVDEAAPPSLMKAVALEIVKRKMTVSWWTNIRFEKSFTKDLCWLLKESGCIGVSGGLEVAGNRLLELINKGISVEQVANVNRNFTEAGIMVHAYLMYGFPTQTEKETIDSLEMVRQMFKAGILKSGFWHQFTMTAHSPVGLSPEKFAVTKTKATLSSFANNDIEHYDNTGIDHSTFETGLKKSIYNYMQEIGLDEPLYKWFDRKVPQTTVPKDYITDALLNGDYREYQNTSKLIFIGILPSIEYTIKSKKGHQWEEASLTFHNKKIIKNIKVDKEKGQWLFTLLQKLTDNHTGFLTMQEVIEDYSQNGFEDFELFWDNKPINQLYQVGLLMI